MRTVSVSEAENHKSKQTQSRGWRRRHLRGLGDFGGVSGSMERTADAGVAGGSGRMRSFTTGNDDEIDDWRELRELCETGRVDEGEEESEKDEGRGELLGVHVVYFDEGCGGRWEELGLVRKATSSMAALSRRPLTPSPLQNTLMVNTQRGHNDARY